ncbi:Tat pathway signal protein [Streptomyces violascens]|uniref:golvesin C-terminal-like domain-containing protein n=1 Tax=Streptomyces violascens TaxID=67381 RepID=UPI00365341F3
MRLSKRARVPVTAVAAAAVLTGLLPGISARADTPTPPATPPAPAGEVQDPGKKLGKDWQDSPDRAVTAAADTVGLRIMVADSGKAYAWKTAATLSEPGLPADSWIGNQCQMDRDHAAVVYAPRSFANKPDLMQGGAFTAIVNMANGQVTKLPFTASLAYFDPSCNTATHTAAFTSFRDMNDPASTRTRVITVDTAGKTTGTTAAKGELTSAVPVKDGTVAALGSRLVHLDRSGTVKNLADADSAPFDIRPQADGKIAFVDRKDTSTATAKVFTGTGKPAAVASGKLGDLDLAQGEAGKVFLTGHPTTTPAVKGTGITPVNAPADTAVSSHGRLAVDPVLTPGVRAGLERVKDAGKGFTKADPSSPERSAAQAPDTVPGNQPVTITSTATPTGTKLTQSMPQQAADASGKSLSPALAPPSAPAPKAALRGAAAVPSNNPVDTDRWCSVSRNDVNVQALQPTPNQVEWAVDMAVRGNLRSNYLRQGGYRDQAGLGTIDPQGLFPPPTLNGGGKIPANVLLGIMAQESNLWQAESGAIPGQMGNPLAAVDGYYGHKAVAGDPDSYWNIHWEKSDCGYGVGQVTDGMRLAGHEKTDANGNKEKLLSPALQKLVAVDYASNIAASMKILADKWNEVHTDGQKITVNNDDSSMVENWYTAVWNYNLGFNPPSEASKHNGNWGLGWYNNPANPLYKRSWGHPFMDTSVDGTEANRDAAHPQDWPYQAKVMGWAAWSIDTGFSYGTDGRQDWPGESGFSSAGFRPAWWDTNSSRSLVSPALGVFCNSGNKCDPDTPPNCKDEACYTQYWWNKPNATWKGDCAKQCGHENIKYQTLISEPGRGYRLKNGTPVCTGAPAGALVVASVPGGTPTWSDCGNISSAGSFDFGFTPGAEGRYEAKADLHQIGGGYGGHFWYAHDRDLEHLGGNGGRMSIDGTWKLGKAVDKGQAKVYAHIPDTGAQTKEAIYQIVTPLGTVKKTVDQGANANKWVDLGAYRFNDQAPEVKLSNANTSGTADKDIAWGAVAFVPGEFDGIPADLTFGDPDPNAPDPAEVEPAEIIPGNFLDLDSLATRSAVGLKAAGPVPAAKTCRTVNQAKQDVICIGPAPQPLRSTPSSSSSQAPSAMKAAAAVPTCSLENYSVSYTRTHACMTGQLLLNRTTAGRPTGQALWDYRHEIQLDASSGTFVQTVTLALKDTAIAKVVTLDMGFDCLGACSSAATEWQGSRTWNSGDRHTLTGTKRMTWTGKSDHSGLTLGWSFNGTMDGAAADPIQRQKGELDVRCDVEVKTTPGCVFSRYKPTYRMDEKKFPAAAAHAWLIQNKLPGHYGLRGTGTPLTFLSNDVLVPPNSNKPIFEYNRDQICPTKWTRSPLATMSPELGANDVSSCDEFPFASSWQSAATPKSWGGKNTNAPASGVSSGEECVNTVAQKGSDGRWRLVADPRSHIPTWTEPCGRSSMSNNQNTQSMSKFPSWRKNNRVLEGDAYWLDAPKP